MRKTALFLALLFAAPMAQADNQYWAIAPGYSKVESGPGDDLEFFTLSALYGYELHPHLGIEGRVGTTLVREELDADHKYSVDFFGSAFVRINVLSEDVRPYVLLGGTYAKVVASGPLVSGSDEESDFSWGVGVSLHVRQHGFHLEYIRYLDKSDFEFNGINLGYTGRF